MTKLLNLDEYSENVERSIKLRGQVYEVKDFTTRESMQFQILWSEVHVALEKDDNEAFIAGAEKIVRFGCPTMTEETVASLQPAQLMAAMQMVGGMVPRPPSTSVTATGDAPTTETPPAAEGEGASGN